MDKVIAFKQALRQEFAIQGLGEVKSFLGCQVLSDTDKQLLWMSSGAKIDAPVENFGLSGETRVVEVPMSKTFMCTAQSIYSYN